jgi:carbon storage regulator
MLVLSRKLGERVLVGEDVEVVVLEVDGGRVKLGFTAPRYVPIFRAEIHQELADAVAAVANAELRDGSADFTSRKVA